MNGGRATPWGVHITAVYIYHVAVKTKIIMLTSFRRKVCFYIYSLMWILLCAWGRCLNILRIIQHLYQSIHTFQILCNKPKVKHIPKLKSNFSTVYAGNNFKSSQKLFIVFISEYEIKRDFSKYHKFHTYPNNSNIIINNYVQPEHFDSVFS